MSAARLLVVAGLLALVAACGGGSSDAPAPAPTPTPTPTPTPVTPVVTASNAMQIVLTRGPDGRSFNSPFVSVTVCVPGSAVCQTIDNILVDTGSYGLRLAASAVGPALALPAVLNASSVPVAECAHFATGFAWGSVRRADLKMSGETASNIPIQVIGEAGSPYGTVPAACSNTGANFGSSIGINGILGVGFLAQDCPACASTAAPAVYFACTAAGCNSTVLARASQVTNPVTVFPVNNNGVLVSLPAVPLGGSPSVSGSLVFGIGTQTNNQLGSETVYTANSRGNFTTRYKGNVFTESFIDSGSNGNFFDDPAIPQCSGGSGFYCPETPLSRAAVTVSSTGVSGTVSFVVESVRNLRGDAVAAHIGGTMEDASAFDWGLPFFFGRNVFVAFSGATTPKGTGPFWAY
ncbi:MAG: DUF3443 domain-containing protein [Ramlibacter sp.]